MTPRRPNSQIINDGWHLGMAHAQQIVDGHATMYRKAFEKASSAGGKAEAEKNMLISCALSIAADFIEQANGMRKVVESNGIERLVPLQGNQPNAK